MDPFQLTVVIGVSVGAGFLGASQKYVRQIRALRAMAISAHAETVTRLTTAAVDTIVEDFKIDTTEACSKFFERCGKMGLKLVRVNTHTGKQEVISNPVEGSKQ